MIKIENVHKVFDGRGIAGLHGVSFELNRGEVVAIMGPNGSGKSTLLNLIKGSPSTDLGKIEIQGEVNFFNDQRSLPSMNVQKFLISQVRHDLDDEKKIQLSRDLADIFEFTFQLRQNLQELSAGQRQKVLLSAELINHPALLLLDEPFTHLDPHTRGDILKSLFTYVRQHEISLLWVTHDLDEALKHSDRLGILNFGKFEQIGPPSEIILNPKNLFVAKFMGYENFMILRKHEESWHTPWGKLPSSTHPELLEAILVIPKQAIRFGEGPSGKILEESWQGLERRFSVEALDLQFQIIQDPRQPYPKDPKIAVSLEFCLLIPL